jgi:hypothetical protein
VIEMAKFNPSTIFETADGEALWQVQGVEVTYNIQVRPQGAEADADDVESMRYPEAVIEDKLERGELERVTEPGEAEVDDPRDCPTCGDGAFEGAVGLRQHRRQVHPDEPELPADELHPDKS